MTPPPCWEGAPVWGPSDGVAHNDKGTQDSGGCECLEVLQNFPPHDSWRQRPRRAGRLRQQAGTVLHPAAGGSTPGLCSQLSGGEPAGDCGTF